MSKLKTRKIDKGADIENVYPDGSVQEKKLIEKFVDKINTDESKRLSKMEEIVEQELNTKDYQKINSMVGSIQPAKEADDFLTAVNKPSHYQGITIKGKNGEMTFEAIEIIDSIVDMLGFNPSASHAIGDALKYQLRCGKKDSDNNTTTDLKNKAKQDLLKASWYLTRASDTM